MEVEERMQTTNFMRDTIRGVRLRVLGEEMAKDARTVSSMQPSMLHRPTTGKNAIGMNEGLVRLKVWTLNVHSKRHSWHADAR